MISKFDTLLAGARKIADKCSQIYLQNEIISIDTFTGRKFLDSDILYFLTNDPIVSENLDIANHTGVYIVNGKYLISKTVKSDTMARLDLADIVTPNRWIISDSDGFSKQISRELDYPVYLKNEQHGKAIKVPDESIMSTTLSSIDLRDGWYIEKAVDDNNRVHKKVYFVGNELFTDGETDIAFNTDIKKKIISVIQTLALDVSSIDILIGASDYYLIDVNHCPALFNSVNAQLAFAELILRMSGRILLK